MESKRKKTRRSKGEKKMSMKIHMQGNKFGGTLHHLFSLNFYGGISLFFLFQVYYPALTPNRLLEPLISQIKPIPQLT